MELFLKLLFVIGFIKIVNASNGDRSYIFGKCTQSCVEKNCTNVTEFTLAQPLLMQLLSWTCLDECKYECMWTTVEAYHRDSSQVPQFFGKWPFIRLAGIQEPASMVFSLLNGLSHLALFQYRAKVPSSTPMFIVWHGMALIGIITWMCAAIFHTKDTPLTEKLDYFSAFGLVLYNLFTLICRATGTKHRYRLILVSVLLTGLYVYHIYYLSFIKFDYGYNMAVNIGIGAVNATGWLTWSLWQWKSKPYVWKCITVILGLNILLGLELGDFPPLFWIFDAHAIWHAGTVPLNLLWYSFIIDDALDESRPGDVQDMKKIV